ncbi:MAG: M1 family aminopeptidase [Syntrophothermus sp.]
MIRKSIILLAFLIISGKLIAGGLYITHYNIDAEIIPKEQELKVKSNFILRNNTNEFFSKVLLYLNTDEIEYIRTKGDREIKYTRDGLKLTLFADIPGNDSIQIFISYRGKYAGPVSGTISEKCTWLLMESRYYPTTTDYKEIPDPFTFDLRAAVPAEMTVVSSGRLLSTTEKEGKRIFYYKADFPVFRISISAAKYKIDTVEFNGIKISTYLFPEDHGLQYGFLKTLTEAFEFYSKKYGGYPLGEFKIAETLRRGGYGPAGFIMLSKEAARAGDIRNEFVLLHELAHQWWGNIVSQTNQNLFTQETMASYSVKSFWEEKGIINEPVEDPAASVLPSFLRSDSKSTRNIFQRVAYHRVFEPDIIANISPEDNDLFYWGYHYKGVLAVNSLELYFGKDNMDKAYLLFFSRYKFKSASLRELISIAEEVSGKKGDKFIEDWFYSNRILDYGISDLSSDSLQSGRFLTRVTVKNNGDIGLPVQLALKDAGGNKLIKEIPNTHDLTSVIEAETDKKITSAELDPLWKTHDADRVNNIYPQKYRFDFLFAMPDVTANQIFYYPTVTFGHTDQVRPGIWLTNRNPIAGRILQRNELPVEFKAGLMYGIGSSRIGYSFEFNTNALMPDHSWRWGARAEDTRGTTVYAVEFTKILYDDLNHMRAKDIRIGFGRSRIYDVSYYDPRDYTKGTNVGISIRYRHLWRSESAGVNFENGSTLFDGRYNFFKLSAEYSNMLEFSSFKITYRGFAGTIWGGVPAQKSIFLSGSAVPSSIPYLFVDPGEKISTQENLHITGDADLRGYAGRHIRDRNGAAVNFSISYTESYFRYLKLFADAGNVWYNELSGLKYDAGLGLDFSILRVDFPLYVSEPAPGEKELDFRILFEVNFPL